MKMVFFPDGFWKCFMQQVDPSTIPDAERDDKRGGWLIPELSLYKDRGYKEPEDGISQGGLATGVTREIETEEVTPKETTAQKKARLLAELAALEEEGE